MTVYVVRLTPGERERATVALQRSLGGRYGYSTSEMVLIDRVRYAAAAGYSGVMTAEAADQVAAALRAAELPELAGRFETGRRVAYRGASGRWRASRA